MDTHTRGHLVYAASGVLSVHTEAGTSIVPANRVAWTPADVAHHHRAHGPTDMRILFLPHSLARLLPPHPTVFTATALAREVLLALTDPSTFDHRTSGSDDPAHSTPADSPTSPADSAALSFDDFNSGTRDHGRPRDRDDAARKRLRRVLVDELYEAREQALQLPEPSDDRLRAVAGLLHENPANDSSLTELGRAVGASARTLSRLFHNDLGTTFHTWRTQLRIYHALILLANGHDTTRTAHACGWSNPSNFITAFTALVGTTPGRYRTARLASS